MPPAPTRDATPIRRCRHSPWLAVLAGFAAACSNGHGGTTGSSRTVAATIGPAGGTLAFVDGNDAGVSIEIPPGAVAEPTRFAIETGIRSPDVLGIFPIYRFSPNTLELAHPAHVTVRLPADADPESLDDDSSSSSYVCFAQREPGAPWLPLANSSVDEPTHTVTADTTRLGDVLAWTGLLHRLMTQPFRFVDPATLETSETVGGTPVLVENGSQVATIGRGSLASFWQSPANENVLILPGLFGNPLDYLDADDVVALLPPSVHNVVLLQYPSGRGIAATANALYDAIAANRQPGFGCTILGHSLGGMVGRYLLEYSAADPDRPDWQPGAPALTDTVVNLVMLGAPQGGAKLGDDLAEFAEANAEPGEEHLLQAAFDISRTPASLAVAMTSAYVDNPTRYHVIYGDLGEGDDGVVSTASATALPLVAPETLARFVAQHDALHSQAGTLGVAALVDDLLAIPRQAHPAKH